MEAIDRGARAFHQPNVTTRRTIGLLLCILVGVVATGVSCGVTVPVAHAQAVSEAEREPPTRSTSGEPPAPSPSPSDVTVVTPEGEEPSRSRGPAVGHLETSSFSFARLR